jgi:hypothetical protein
MRAEVDWRQNEVNWKDRTYWLVGSGGLREVRNHKMTSNS